MPTKPKKAKTATVAAVRGGHRQGYLLEFIGHPGVNAGPRPVAVFPDLTTGSRALALTLANEHWRYMFAREDFSAPKGWVIHDGHPTLFLETGPRNCIYRLVPIKVFLS